MTKNENGYPINTSRDGDAAPTSCNVGDSPCEKAEHSGCGGSSICLDSVPLAYVYAPNQKFRMLYSAKDALSHGTLFEELYKPMEVYGNE